MKKNYKLKVICLLCAFTAVFSSCKKNELAEEKGLKGNQKNLAVAGDGKWDLLGHGYDITGELFKRKNASLVSIIDIDRFYADYPNRIPTPTDSEGGHYVYYGATAYDYVRDINRQRTFGHKVTVTDPQTMLSATTDFSLTNDKQNTYTYSSKYSYATFESWWRVKSIDFTDDVTVELLKNYLTPDFIAYLSNYSAEEIVKTYGTHILLGIDLGGRLKYDHKGSVVKETTFDRKLEAIKAGFSIGIEKLFKIDLSANLSKEQKTTISNETAEKVFSGTVYGGSHGGQSFSGDAKGNISTNFNLAGWQQSINANNASLININKSAPIYEFIIDPVKKQQVKAAVEKYISDRQIKELGEVPVYRFTHEGNWGNVYTINKNDYAYEQNGWKNLGVAFYAIK